HHRRGHADAPVRSRTGVREPPPAQRPRGDAEPSDLRLLAEAALRFPARAGALGMVPKTIGMLAGFALRRRNDEAGMALPRTPPRTPFNKTITPHREIGRASCREGVDAPGARGAARDVG